MARFGTLGTRYTNKDGSILTDGVIDFSDSGTNDVKPTFADIDETASLQNPDPFELNADGSQPNCFFSGSAKGILRSLSKGQIDVLDPITASGSEGGRLAFASWNALSTYRQPDLVTASDGLYYKCIVTSSQGNEPSANESDWSQVKFVGVWNTNQDYILDDIVQASDGYLYVNISAGSGDDPITVKASWRALSIQIYSATTTYEIGEVVQDSTGLLWSSIAATNINNTPASNPDKWESAFLSTIKTGITAGTTQTQAGATALIADINEISVCANENDGLKLRPAAAARKQKLINNGAQAAKVYPDTDDKIDDGAADAADPVLLAVGEVRNYVSIDGVNWYSETDAALITAIEFISAASASNDANIDFTLPGGFDEYELRMLNIVVATDNVPLWFRTSTDAGSSFDSGASDYIWSILSAAESTASVSSSTADAQIVLSGGIGDAVSQAFSGVLRIIRPAEATETTVYGTAGYANASVTPKATFGGSMGQRQSAADVDAIQVKPSSGNIVSGLFALYGVNRI